jgi:hypothetical protein
MKRKIFVTIMTLVLTFSAICFPKNTIETVSASGGSEDVSFDYEWIYDIIANMSGIVNNITTHGIYEGRYFGGEGDHTLTKQGPGEGNYWDDYTGEDNNVDGIGDTPYMLDEADQEDSYPVMESYNWCNDWE